VNGVGGSAIRKIGAIDAEGARTRDRALRRARHGDRVLPDLQPLV